MISFLWNRPRKWRGKSQSHFKMEKIDGWGCFSSSFAWARRAFMPGVRFWSSMVWVRCDRRGLMADQILIQGEKVWQVGEEEGGSLFLRKKKCVDIRAEFFSRAKMYMYINLFVNKTNALHLLIIIFLITLTCNYPPFHYTYFKFSLQNL